MVRNRVDTRYGMATTRVVIMRREVVGMGIGNGPKKVMRVSIRRVSRTCES
jgi:hypothetical protein